MRYIVLSLCAAVFLLISYNGCSDSPKILGLGLVAPQDAIIQRKYTTAATSDLSVLKRAMGTTSTLFGAYQDPLSSQPLEARALLQFVGFTVIPDTAHIDSAVIALPINYKFYNTAGTAVISIHELDTSWSYSSFTWDSSNVSGMYTPTADTSLILPIATADTVMSIHIEPLVRRWVSDQTYAPHGIIIIPITGPGFSDIIVGQRTVASTDVHPSLTVTYHLGSDTTTHTLITSSAQETFVANGTTPSVPSLLMTQAGVSYRGLIRFDSLSLPKRVSISKALFEFSVDENSSLLNSYTNDSLYAHIALKNISPYDSLALGTLCTRISTGTGRTYRADVKNIVQQWVVRNPNYGIIVRPYGEYMGFDRFAIYGAAAPDSLRPKLTITYSVLP